MNAERLAEILEAYGADPKRWPADERAAAEALLAAGAGAEALAEARALDAALATDDAGAPSELLMRRLQRAAPRAVSWRAAAALAACAVLGLVLGYGGAMRLAPPDAADAVFGAAFDIDALEGGR